MNIVVLGGGVAGLLAVRALFEKHGHRGGSHSITLVEGSERLGGNLAAGGLKYIRSTERSKKLLRDLGLPTQEFHPQGGVALECGEFCFYPMRTKKHTRLLPYLQRLHWMKTRGGTLDGFDDSCMNDPMGDSGAKAKAIVCSMPMLVQRLADFACSQATVRTNSPVLRIDLEQKRIAIAGVVPAFIPYDFIINTLHIGAINQVAPELGLPNAESGKISLFDLDKRIPLPPFDYIYTPLDPVASRLSRHVLWWQAEAPGDLSLYEYNERSSFKATKKVAVMPGHLYPLSRPAEWPDNIRPLGRFAQWSSRATTEVVMEAAWTIANQI